jgi:RNA polymerase sigma factor (sigma-70 family)
MFSPTLCAALHVPDMDAPETLLEHATWLRHLAAGLVGDRNLADDLVQDTWVAALRHPPDGGRPFRPWLARVVRNAARFRWRGDANRAAREAITADHAETVTPTSEALLARHQLQQLVARLVGELDEPFRATILLRYAEGLEPTQIARQLAIPAGTVRWRIKEALEHLRCGLDDAHAGDRKAWLLALVPLALWPRVSHGAPVLPIGLALVAVAGLAIMVGAMQRRSHASERSTSGRGRIVTTVTRHAGDPGAPSWFVQPGAAARHVTGRVVRDGIPVAGAAVRLVADDAEPLEARSDGEGRFDFGVQGARTIMLGAAAPDTLAAIRHLELRDPTVATDVELPLLACPARIAGTVTDASGTPIAHARVLREDTIGTETDRNGAYELCALPTAALVAQLDLVVRADGYGAIATGVAPAGRTHRDFVLAPEATITGSAVANAAIWLEPDRNDLSRTGERAARQVAIADGDGRFRITGASGGRYRLGGAAHGQLAVGALVSVEAGGTTDVTVRMVPAATVHGRVVAHGTPVIGARVAVRSDSIIIRHDDPSRDEVAAGHAVTQADGSFVLDGVPVGPTSLTAEPVRIVTPPSVLVAGDNTVTLDAEPLGRIRGVVRRHGAPVPYARIDMNGPVKRGITSDGAGRYDLDGLEPGPYEFYADDQRRGAFISTAPVTLGEGQTLDHDLELAWGAQISGMVDDASGAPVRGVNVRFSSPSGEQARCTTDDTGAFLCGSLKGGASYAPTVAAGDDATRPFPFVTPAPAIELGVDASVTGIRLAIDPRTARIAGTVLDETGAPAVDVRVRASGAGIPYYAWSPAPTVTTDAAGRFRFDHLAPGDYELEAETLHDARSATRIVAAGTADAVLALVRPTCASGVSLDPPHKPASPIVWDDRIELVGWDLPAHARVGEPIEVTLVFRVTAPVAHAWKLFAHFDSSAHRRNADHAAVSDTCPTSTWKPGDVLVDRFSTTLPFAETFALKLGFFRPGEGDAPWQNLAGPGDIAGVDIGSVVASAPR